MQTITTAIIKGGTGKSTTAAAILQAAAYMGRRVLAVDLDPQGNLSFFLSASGTGAAGAYQLLHGQEVKKAIQETPQGIDLISASPDLATETTKPASAQRLKNALLPIKDNYDLIIIDTPPQMGELTYNALYAATGLIIPLEADNSSLQGLYQITGIARQIQKNNPELTILGSVITRYDGRLKLNRFFLDTIKEAEKETGARYLGAIRQAVAVREAQAMQKSLFEYAPKCKAAADYMQLTKKII